MRTTMDSCRASAILGQIVEMALPDELGGEQKLHGATFGLENTQSPPDDSDQISDLLDHIGEGLRADDATNFEKLTIARKYGPLLWQLKTLTVHGEFKKTLKERFPKINYAKCNRWMFIAKEEKEVADAIEKYPDVAWGPKKMIDYLKGWSPEEEQEEDEEDSDGFIVEDSLTEQTTLHNDEVNHSSEANVIPDVEVGTLNSDFPEKSEDNQQHESLEAQAKSPAPGPVPKAVRKKPRFVQTLPFKRPEVQRTEYDIEVRIGFKFSVSSDVSVDDIKKAIGIAKHWTLGIETSFDNELSEMGVAIGHVQPWTAPAPVVQE